MTSGLLCAAGLGGRCASFGFFGFSGRIGCAEYWRVTLFLAGLLLLLGFVISRAGAALAGRSHADLPIPALLAALFFGVPLGVGRPRERDQSEWRPMVSFVSPVILDRLGEALGSALEFGFSLASAALFAWAFVELACEPKRDFGKVSRGFP
jgi:uncharacterized membrane protein YhaH (DUF805 family)